MDVSSILESLNESQREAVAAESGNLLVLAGAGSGKTRVLVHRIAWLIQAEGLSPWAILAVTFTNRAAKEMRARIEAMLEIRSQGMWVGTFHGLAHRLLKAHWRDAGLQQNFQILDADDQLRVIKRLSRALELDENNWPPRQSQWYINGKKDEGLRAAHLEAAGSDAYERTMQRLYAAYEEACERGGMVDFAELLLRSHELWLKHPELLAHYQERFRHILVDEFQDTNTIQYAWLRVLAGDGKQLPVAAVGDDDQSIYGWRGAKIDNILEFSKDFTPVRTIRLEQNYRSTGVILQAANKVIENNPKRLGKNLWTAGSQGEPIALYAAYNEQDEARFIVEQLVNWREAGHARRESAVLYRSNAQSRVLEEALIRAAIPYRIHGGFRFYERLEIKNALAYMRLLISRADDASVERVINTPVRGIGGKTLDGLRALARGRGVSLWQAIAIMREEKLLPQRALSALEGFQSLVNELDSGTEQLSLEELAEHVIEASGLLAFHGKERGEQGLARVENLRELIDAARQFKPENDEITPLQEFLDAAALDAGDAQAEAHEDSVELMTLHSAKGLEFPLVILAGMEENLFPHRMSMEEPGRLEEERRLCYVGITRAMAKLIICYAESRRLHGQESYNEASRFVREIPAELLEEVRMHTAVVRPAGKALRKVAAGMRAAADMKTAAGRAADRAKAAGKDIAATGINLGQRVRHKTFGDGIVLNFEGHGASARVQVKFENSGSKWLVLQYSNLQTL